MVGALATRSATRKAVFWRWSIIRTNHRASSGGVANMTDELTIKTQQAQLDEGRDLLKFVVGEYLKWYVAFLTMNLVALSFANQLSKPQLIAIAFFLLDSVGAWLAFDIKN